MWLVLLSLPPAALIRVTPVAQVHYTLDRPPVGWKFSSGLITTEMARPLSAPLSGKLISLCPQIRDHLPAFSKDTQVRCFPALWPHSVLTQTQILVCGPPPMIKFACRPAFEQLGFKEENLLIW